MKIDNNVEKPAPIAEQTPREQFRQRFLEKLSSRAYNFVTVEVGMPQGYKTQAVRDGCHMLGQKGTDALNLADNPNAVVRLHPLAFQSRLQQRGPAYMDSIYHITCRDKNLIALQTEILGAASMSITALLCVTGDAVRKGPEPAKSVFEGNSMKLIEIVRNMNQGKLMSGEELEEPTDLVIGVAYNANAKDINAETERLLRKIEAGAQFAETQPVHSKEAFNRCVDALARYGLTQDKFPVIFGLMPVMSRKNGEFLNRYFSGIDIPEAMLAQFDRYTRREDREMVAYQQTLELAMHFVQDQTNNYYLICPFNRYELVARIVEFVKFGYSAISYKGETIVQRDFARTPRTVGVKKFSEDAQRFVENDILRVERLLGVPVDPKGQR